MFDWLFGKSEKDAMEEYDNEEMAQAQYRKKLEEIHQSQSEEHALSQGGKVWVKGFGPAPQVIYWTENHKSVLENGRYVSYFLKQGE